MISAAFPIIVNAYAAGGQIPAPGYLNRCIRSKLIAITSTMSHQRMDPIFWVIWGVATPHITQKIGSL
jgi:hypothetical protein